MTIVEQLSRLERAALADALTRCCAARAWVERLMATLPLGSDEELLRTAAEIWETLSPADWLEAFAAHPRIGDLDSLRSKFADTRGWAVGEQSGVGGASDATLYRLAELNREYEEKFGYIFIVCATGKSADEMLAILESRLPNDAPGELRIAAAEQLKITLIRLRKLAP